MLKLGGYPPQKIQSSQLKEAGYALHVKWAPLTKQIWRGAAILSNFTSGLFQSGNVSSI